MKNGPKPQDVEKAQTEAQILNTLERGPLRWKELKEQTKTTIKSTRTLSSRLQELQKNGLIRRIVNNNVYPPAVTYELASNAVLVTGSPGDIVIVIRQLLREIETNRKILQFFKDNKTSPEDVLIHYLEDFDSDFLFAMMFSFENPEKFPYIIFQMKELYAVRMSSLFEYWQKQPEMMKTVKEAFNAIEQKRKQEQNFSLEKYATPFTDKPLAKAIIRLYSQKIIQREKGSAYDFLKRVAENKELKKELEETLGCSIDDNRLAKTMAETGWKTLTVKS